MFCPLPSWMQWDRWIDSLANYNIHIHYKSRKSNIEANASSRIEWEKCNEPIQAESIQAVVAAAIAGDLANIEAFSCSMQTIEPFLPNQSEPMAFSKLSHGHPIRVI